MTLCVGLLADKHGVAQSGTRVEKVVKSRLVDLLTYVIPVI